MEIRRLLPLSGIAFVVLALVGVVGIGGDTPADDASAAKIFSFYDAHSVRQSVAAFVFAVSVPFLVFFGVSLATSLWAEGADQPVWQCICIGGSAVAGAGLLVSAWVHFALADGADNTIAVQALQGLNTLDATSWVAWNAGLGVMMLGAAGCVLGRSRAHRWMGWAAIVLGVLLFIPFADFFALVLTLIWIIVASLMLFRGSISRSTAVA